MLKLWKKIFKASYSNFFQIVTYKTEEFILKIHWIYMQTY